MSNSTSSVAEERVVPLIQIKPAFSYKGAYASEIGEIFKKRKNKFIHLKLHEKKTTKGSYLNCCVFDITKGKRTSTGAHRVVCEAWHGKPPDDKDKNYVPDHLDEDKHNNHAKNLAWTTQSQNVQNAFDRGVCTAGLRVIATNVISGNVIHYNSLSRLARDFNQKRWKMRDIVSNHRKILYKNEWLFKVDAESDKKISRYQRQSIIYKNYVTGKITITDSVAAAAYETGVAMGNIFATLKHNRKRLYSGFFFIKVSSEITFPEFSDEQLKIELARQ